jgi:hypothetical protein
VSGHDFNRWSHLATFNHAVEVFTRGGDKQSGGLRQSTTYDHSTNIQDGGHIGDTERQPPANFIDYR